MRRNALLFALLLGTLALGGCAPGPHPVVGSVDGLPGFWAGLWHGFITLFTFVISLFSDKVAIYETANSGHLYDLGYVLGLMLFWGGSSGKACCGRRK